MAYETGTATDHNDLFNKLVLFLTTNAALVAAGQAWEKLYDQTVAASGVILEKRYVVLRAPGLSGDDDIYLGLRRYADSALDYYNTSVCGGTGFVEANIPAGGDIRSAFVGASPIWVDMAGWNQPMPYWLIANGRRFAIGVKVSTIYESMYAGFILPPCPPTQYPYPLCIAGSFRGDTAARWSNVEDRHRGITSPRQLSCWLRDTNGVWKDFSAEIGDAGGPGEYQYRLLLPLGANRHDATSYSALWNIRDSFGVYPLLPCTFMTTAGSEGTRVLGDYDGVYWVPTLNSGAEDVIQIGGVDHIVLQTAWRSGNPYLFVLRAQ